MKESKNTENNNLNLNISVKIAPNRVESVIKCKFPLKIKNNLWWTFRCNSTLFGINNLNLNKYKNKIGQPTSGSTINARSLSTVVGTNMDTSIDGAKTRRARTLYPCEADNPSELSFEANVIISNGIMNIQIFQKIKIIQSVTVTLRSRF